MKEWRSLSGKDESERIYEVEIGRCRERQNGEGRNKGTDHEL